MTTSVLLADFQFLTRQGIASLIDSIPGFEIIHQINKSTELKKAIEEIEPDLAILDISGSDKALLTDLKEIKKTSSAKFLIISNSQNKESIRRLIDIGIKGIVTKNCSEQEITSALVSVNKNERFFCNKILDLVIEDQNNKDQIIATKLTTRELEVLKLIATGNKTNQIAKNLFLSVHTINSHRKNILKKLNMKSPIELVAYAFQNGLIKSL
ncbi:MAG: DNA-binding NarL/FixJ family response regulator [Cyclobacteriaceae bacterium]